MREILVMTSAYARLVRADCQGGGGKAGQPLGTGVFGQFSLVVNRVVALHLARDHIGGEQWDKDKGDEWENLILAETSRPLF